MGPGPARGGADGAPLSPYVLSLIQRKAKQLCRRRGFRSADRKDLIQELTARLLAKTGKYDPGRGASLNTFANRVIESAVRMLLRDAVRQKRAAGLAAASLDGGSVIIDGQPVPLTEVVSDADRERVTGGALAPRTTATELADAVEQALSPLPPFVVEVARQLQVGNASAACKALGVSRRKVYAAIAMIRERLEAAGLGPGKTI